MFASKDDLVQYWSYSVQLTVLYLTNTTYNLFPNPLCHWGPKHNSYTYLPLECTYMYSWIGNGTILQNVQIMESNQLCNYTHMFLFTYIMQKVHAIQSNTGVRVYQNLFFKSHFSMLYIYFDCLFLNPQNLLSLHYENFNVLSVSLFILLPDKIGIQRRSISCPPETERTM